MNNYQAMTDIKVLGKAEADIPSDRPLVELDVSLTTSLHHAIRPCLCCSKQPPLQAADKRTSISFARLCKTLQTRLPKRRPKVARQREAVPELSLARRQSSLDDHAFANESDLAAAQKEQRSVLYLAYGSNLCYETFQGRRGVKPIAQVNVVVPELRMTFNLPGIPYTEPCFANSAWRHTEGSESKETQGKDYHKDRWTKGMVGVVYEVTPSDYAHIIATEGGGSSYQDVLVTCYPISSEGDVPEVPTTAPFKSHTLLSPALGPPKGGKPGPPGGGRFQRPDPSYAQASARYLKLLTDGADEHKLPAEYKTYLHDLRPYKITSQKQRLGQFVLLSLWAPFIALIFALNRAFQDKKGRSPKWLAMLSKAIFSSVWTSYDNIFKPLFGDGERTMPRGRRHKRNSSGCRSDEEWLPEEKYAE
jgi:hypothetical protein